MSANSRDPTRVAVEARCSPTTTSISAPTSPTRRRRTTSRRPTRRATGRPPTRAGIAELGIAEHIHRFSQSLEIWRHPFWVEQATDDLDAYCEFLAASGLKVGIEADYVAGAEERIRDLLEARPFDFVIGSVHFVGDSSVDQDRWDVWEAEGNDPDRVWSRYFEQLADAAGSGLYDTMAHPDLVKVWGAGRPGPERDPAALLRARRRGDRRGRASRSRSRPPGLRKPIGEMYPAAAFAELCVEAGIPFTLSSDAHRPEEVGYAYERGGRVHEGPRDRGDLRVRRPRANPGAARMSARVGIGYDSHRLAEGRPLIIGGVEIPFERGLDGHSDADVLAHAITDAILGAAGAGDIGSHFPPTDERWRDADSIELLAAVIGLIGGRVVNVDATVICERPPIGPHREAIEAKLERGGRRTRVGQGDDERGARGDRARGGHRRDRGGILRARR